MICIYAVMRGIGVGHQHILVHQVTLLSLAFLTADVCALCRICFKLGCSVAALYSHLLVTPIALFTCHVTMPFIAALTMRDGACACIRRDAKTLDIKSAGSWPAAHDAY